MKALLYVFATSVVSIDVRPSASNIYWRSTTEVNDLYPTTNIIYIISWNGCGRGCNIWTRNVWWCVYNVLMLILIAFVLKLFAELWASFFLYFYVFNFCCRCSYWPPTGSSITSFAQPYHLYWDAISTGHNQINHCRITLPQLWRYYKAHHYVYKL
jgi:hypothetical protein